MATHRRYYEEPQGWRVIIVKEKHTVMKDAVFETQERTTFWMSMYLHSPSPATGSSHLTLSFLIRAWQTSCYRF